MPDIETFHDGEMDRRLGCLVSDEEPSVAAFEDSVDLLSWTEIEAIARSGELDGEKLYGEEFVLDQLQHSSCNPHAAAEVTMKTLVDDFGIQHFHKLSGTYLYSIIIGNGPDAGSSLVKSQELVMSRGMCLDSTCPSNIIRRSGYDTTKADAEALRFRADECYPAKTMQGLWSGLAKGYHAVVCVQVGGSFSQLDSRWLPGFSNGRGNHAVSIDGIKWDGGLLGTASNSWRVSWGARGRMRLDIKRLEQPFDVHTMWLMKGCRYDPQNTPLPGLAQ